MTRMLRGAAVLSVLAFGISLPASAAEKDNAPVPSNAPKKSRVWEVAAPLYQELLSDQPPGLRRDGEIIWRTGWCRAACGRFASSMGLPGPKMVGWPCWRKTS